MISPAFLNYTQHLIDCKPDCFNQIWLQKLQ